GTAAPTGTRNISGRMETRTHRQSVSMIHCPRALLPHLASMPTSSAARSHRSRRNPLTHLYLPNRFSILSVCSVVQSFALPHYDEHLLGQTRDTRASRRKL